MPTDVFDDVAAFMRIGQPDKIAELPENPNEETRTLCENLVREEFTELLYAMERDTPTEVADGIADLVYVAIFTAHCYGIPIAKVWDEVQRTNMAKFPDGEVLRRESDGKIMKPEGWEPPNIAAILNRELPCVVCGSPRGDFGSTCGDRLCVGDEHGDG